MAGALKRWKTHASPKEVKASPTCAEKSIGEHTYRHVTHLAEQCANICFYISIKSVIIFSIDYI